MASLLEALEHRGLQHQVLEDCRQGRVAVNLDALNGKEFVRYWDYLPPEFQQDPQYELKYIKASDTYATELEIHIKELEGKQSDAET